MENLDQSNNKNVSLNLLGQYGGTDSESDDAAAKSNKNVNNEDSDAAELSDMVIKNNIINACAHGPLANTGESDEDDDDNENDAHAGAQGGTRTRSTRHMIIDSTDSGVMEYEVSEYRDADSDTDPSSSDSSDGDSVKDIIEMSSGDELENNTKTNKMAPPKVTGELGLDDLPPIEDLAISLPSQETTKIGTIISVIDRLVVVRALPGTPAVDLDSVLFLDNGAKALGKVFDVFGPVTEPHYCVRFNSASHAAERGARPGAPVYYAPRDNHTSYVYLADLMKMKGSDASWLHDVEPPPHQIDYSDDEEERKANKMRKEKNKNQEDPENSGETSKNVRKVPERRNQRPSESSSRFGAAPSRGRNPFSAGSRRSNNPNAFPRFMRPWSMDMRTPPPHPHEAHGAYPLAFRAPMFPSFSSSTPPPFIGNMFQFGGSPRFQGPMPPLGAPPPFVNMPIFGTNYCAQPQWVNHGPPPPPGT